MTNPTNEEIEQIVKNLSKESNEPQAKKSSKKMFVFKTLFIKLPILTALSTGIYFVYDTVDYHFLNKEKRLLQEQSYQQTVKSLSTFLQSVSERDRNLTKAQLSQISISLYNNYKFFYEDKMTQEEFFTNLAVESNSYIEKTSPEVYSISQNTLQNNNILPNIFNHYYNYNQIDFCLDGSDKKETCIREMLPKADLYGSNLENIEMASQCDATYKDTGFCQSPSNLRLVFFKNIKSLPDYNNYIQTFLTYLR